MKKLIFLSLALLFTGFSYGQTGYKIQFHIDGLRDTTMLLGHFYGESTYVKDTARLNDQGHLTFEGSDKLAPGIYFLVLNKSRLFDFVVSADQHFKVAVSYPEFLQNVQVDGDIDNQLFFDDIQYNITKNLQAEPFLKILKDSTATETHKLEARNQLDKLNDEVVAHQEYIIQQYPQSFVAKLFRANKRIDVPEAPAGVDKSQFGYHYYKNHYWDYFDLSDPALLRLSQPLYRKKVEDYLDKLVLPTADSIIKEIDKLATQAKQSDDTYKYFVWTVTLKYQNPELMGQDAIFVHLYDQYYKNGEMDFWANEQLKNNLKERAEQLRLSLIGKTAPNMIMLDAQLMAQSLYDIQKKYTIVYFFDPDCGHCKKETPVLNEFYKSTNFDVEVFAVSADTSMVKMKNYIKDMDLDWITVNGPRTMTGSYQKQYDANTTPTLYVLDEKKKIIAKKIPANKLEEFLSQYEKLYQKK